jgi:hypothetical protein
MLEISTKTLLYKLRDYQIDLDDWSRDLIKEFIFKTSLSRYYSET